MSGAILAPLEVVAPRPGEPRRFILGHAGGKNPQNALQVLNLSVGRG